MEKQTYCEISGLPVTERPEWKDIILDKNYKVSFSLIGDNIIKIVPEGKSTTQGFSKFLEIREAFIRELGLWDLPHIVLKDYSRIEGLPSKEGRSLNTELLVAESKRGKLKGMLIYKCPMVIRWLFNVGLRIHNSPRFICILKSYKEAILRAVSINKGEIGTEPAVNDAAVVGNKQTYTKEAIKNYIDELLLFIESAPLNEEELTLRPVLEDNPFKLLYDVISVVKIDFYNILKKERQNNKLLRESEQKYKALSEKLSDFLFIASPDLELTFTAGDVLNTLGFTKEEILKFGFERVLELVHPGDQREINFLVDRVRNNLVGGTLEIRMKQKDQNYGWIQCSLSPLLDDKNQLTGIHGLMRNIDKQKQNEEKFLNIQQQLVDTAHQAGKTQLVTGIIHDIGNVLNSVNISIDMMNKTVNSSKVESFLQANALLSANIENLTVFLTDHEKGKFLPEFYLALGDELSEENVKMKEELELLQNKVLAIKDIIVAQQKYAKDRNAIEKVDLFEVINDALILQDSFFKKYGIRIKRDYINKEKFFIKAHKTKLINVLINIFKNAVEAMEDIDFDRRYIKVEVEVIPDEKVIIMVSDNGSGIEPENLQKIFKYGMTTKEYGHGFGLNTCKNYIKEMGGEIYAVSQGHGKGSRMLIEFPFLLNPPERV